MNFEKENIDFQNKIICGDCIDITNKWPNKFIDLTITSPPYDNLRDYDNPNFDWKSFKIIVKNLWNITKSGGVIVWIVGDATIKGSETGTSFRQALYFMNMGFNLHDTMIYRKNNFSNPSNNRYHQIWEYMFIFSKGKPKTFNPIKDKKNKYAGQTSWGKITVRQKDGSLIERPKQIISEYGMRYNIWKYAVGKGFSAKGDLAFQHPAIFPEKLAIDHIKSWSNEGDLILDPMCGSGTTLLAAKQLNRRYIGIDISAKYCEIAKERLENEEKF